jgi:RND family efflux transporter MFP subunit
MRKKSFTLILVACLLTACADKDATTRETAAPWVRTVALQGQRGEVLNLSGTVRARHETAIAFQVGGRIKARRVDAGQRVDKGQILFELDPRDLAEAARASQAESAAAQAARAIAQADVERNRQLAARNFISPQALARSELTEREASTRVDAAQARARQATNALDYANVRADRAGILMEVSGEAGQVIAPGQALATLASEGEREIEVFFPDGSKPPAEGMVMPGNGQAYPMQLREVAGAADPGSRTWRARYRLPQEASGFALGAVVKATFNAPGADTAGIDVPLGALDERGDGARIWHIVDGKAQPVPARIIALAHDSARIEVKLPPGSRIIALGTHLLQPGMAVRELAQ